MTERTPIKQLSTLLAELKPALDRRAVVFYACAPDEEPDLEVLEPLATVWEPEGLSLVLTQRAAERAGLSSGTVFRWITLTVHSSLEAVGLTAAVAQALADEGIPANVIAGRVTTTCSSRATKPSERSASCVRSAPQQPLSQTDPRWA